MRGAVLPAGGPPLHGCRSRARSHAGRGRPRVAAAERAAPPGRRPGRRRRAQPYRSRGAGRSAVAETCAPRPRAGDRYGGLPAGRRPMVERLTPLEASFLYLEEPSTPMHVAGVLLLEPPAGGVDAVAELVAARL